jgi:hypothetical protein
LHPRGAEIVTVSLELSGPAASRPFIEAARPEHPSLLDPEHRMDALFGVVNIPNVVWIDEQGLIVRPAEPGWPDARQRLPDRIREGLPRVSRAKTAPPPPANPIGLQAMLAGGQDRQGYAGAIRDWVEKGPASSYVLTPAQVVAHSQPRSPDLSAGAAHFELANYLWRNGQRGLAIDHFNEAHRLQPGNWTYKRQAWSLVGNERVGGEFGRFAQGPLPGEEDDWPFVSDFHSDTALLVEGEYYPKTL